MPTLEQRVKFAESCIKNKDGRPWSIKGRDWILEEFWGPCDGYKLWPNDVASLCDTCAERSGEILEWDWKVADNLGCADCAGLRLEPIIMTVLNLPRREGKTFNSAAFGLSTGCLTPRRFVTFMAGAKDQTDTLLQENYGVAIDQSAKLQKHCKLVGSQIRFPKTKSKIECVATAASVTGRGRSHIIMDEARDVPG